MCLNDAVAGDNGRKKYTVYSVVALLNAWMAKLRLKPAPL